MTKGVIIWSSTYRRMQGRLHDKEQIVNAGYWSNAGCFGGDEGVKHMKTSLAESSRAFEDTIRPPTLTLKGLLF